MKFSEIQYIYNVEQLSPLSSSRFSPLQRKPIPIKQSFLIPHLHSAPGNCHLFSFSVYWPVLDILNNWNNMICGLFVFSFFQVAQCFQGSSVLQHVPVLYFSLGLNNISLYGYTALCISTYQLVDIWIVSTFWLL